MRLFFNLECLNIVDIAAYDVKFQQVKFSVILKLSMCQGHVTVEVRPGNVTIVYNAKVTENCSKDFANFWSEVRYRYSEKNNEALFSKKIFE